MSLAVILTAAVRLRSVAQICRRTRAHGHVRLTHIYRLSASRCRPIAAAIAFWVEVFFVTIFELMTVSRFIIQFIPLANAVPAEPADECG